MYWIVWYGTVLYDVVWYSMVWYCTVIVWYRIVWYSMVWWCTVLAIAVPSLRPFLRPSLCHVEEKCHIVGNILYEWDKKGRTHARTQARVQSTPSWQPAVREENGEERPPTHVQRKT